MKRNILIYGCEKLTTDDYINFIEQCYKYWQNLPVKDVDLIIEYQDDFEMPTLCNTSDNWIWGMYDIGGSIDDIAHYAETELQCKHYILARIRDSIIRDFGVIKWGAIMYNEIEYSTKPDINGNRYIVKFNPIFYLLEKE